MKKPNRAQRRKEISVVGKFRHNQKRIWRIALHWATLEYLMNYGDELTFMAGYLWQV